MKTKSSHDRSPSWRPLQLRTGILFLFAILCVAVAGCRKGPVRPKTVPVDVTVSYQDKLVSGATVIFIPKDGPRGAAGRTDAQGIARMMTYKTGDGVIPGRYTVTVDKLLDEAGPAGKSQEEYEAFWKANKGPANLPPLKCELPWKYGQAEKTSLEADVQEKGNNSFRFDLVD